MAEVRQDSFDRMVKVKANKGSDPPGSETREDLMNIYDTVDRFQIGTTVHTERFLKEFQRKLDLYHHGSQIEKEFQRIEGNVSSKAHLLAFGFANRDLATAKEKEMQVAVMMVHDKSVSHGLSFVDEAVRETSAIFDLPDIDSHEFRYEILRTNVEDEDRYIEREGVVHFEHFFHQNDGDPSMVPPFLYSPYAVSCVGDYVQEKAINGFNFPVIGDISSRDDHKCPRLDIRRDKAYIEGPIPKIGAGNSSATVVVLKGDPDIIAPMLAIDYLEDRSEQDIKDALSYIDELEEAVQNIKKRDQ